MFRPLAFITVRKQHDQAGEQAPLVFAGHNKLVDDDLRAVSEIAKLRFPQSQAIRIVAAESVLKAQYGGFREDRVVSLKPRLAWPDIAERHVFFFSFRINQTRVAMVERSTACVLPGKPHWNTLNQQRSK